MTQAFPRLITQAVPMLSVLTSKAASVIVGLASAVSSQVPQGLLHATEARVSSSAFQAPAAVDDGRGTPYVVDKDDTICGLSKPWQLTNPAKIDYDALLAETKEMKEMKRNKISPGSAKGIELTAKARSRVRDACESVRSTRGHCSIWKNISRRDKTAITDLTSVVKAQLVYRLLH